MNQGLKPEFWRHKRVLVTGGSGFLGSHIAERLTALGANVTIPRRSKYNFTQFDQAKMCLQTYQPQMVIHSAAYYGGLGITMAEPGRIFLDNLLLGINTLEASRLAGVRKFVTVGTACSYPGYLENSLKESDLWAGPVHDSVAAYGMVKKILAIGGDAYRKQYNFSSIHLIPSNLYGPRDCYAEYRSHVVAALIKKFCEAHSRAENVEVWGTGNAIREFLFVEDCAEGILLAAQNYDQPEPLNLGTGMGTSIRQLSEHLCSILSFKGKVQWDCSRPDGQLKKILDITKMKDALGWTPPTSLRKGLEKTVHWYQTTQMNSGSRPPTRRDLTPTEQTV